jgi:hypothetical protein
MVKQRREATSRRYSYKQRGSMLKYKMERQRSSPTREDKKQQAGVCEREWWLVCEEGVDE